MYEASFEQPPKKQPALPPQPQELPPLLPAHIEETIRSIARLHAEHHQNATPLQRATDRITTLVGSPRHLAQLREQLTLELVILSEHRSRRLSVNRR